MSVTKAAIVKNISHKAKINSYESARLINLFLALTVNEVKSKQVKISGFGTFSNKLTEKRVGRNPKTKESYIIKPRRKVIFKTSNKIKNLFNK